MQYLVAYPGDGDYSPFLYMFANFLNHSVAMFNLRAVL